MTFSWSYLTKLVGALALASFGFVLPAFAQVMVPRFESGRLVLPIQDETSKSQLASGQLKAADYLQVFVNNPAENPAQPAMLGDFFYAEAAIYFTPLIALQKGRTYYLLVQGKELHTVLIPEVAYVPPKVVAIYPSADTLPANQLKLYLHFNVPMGAGKAYEQVKLVRDGRDTLLFPFVRLEPELWNREKNRLTLWLDPGRVKRDLNPNRELGAPLQFGSNYELIVEAAWEDQQGHALGAPFIKNFFVRGDDRKKPDVSKWKIQTPKAGTSAPLRIEFGEPMDQALASRVIEVLNVKKESLVGSISFQNQEKVVLFTPDQPWQAGMYQLRIGAELEDLAGNNLNRLFDVDLQKEASGVANETFYWLVFEVKK